MDRRAVIEQALFRALCAYNQIVKEQRPEPAQQAAASRPNYTYLHFSVKKNTTSCGVGPDDLLPVVVGVGLDEGNDR